MKILLLNENPVVNKLVTLSAHKTSDELEVASSIEDVKDDHYDLIVIDDTLYSEESFNTLKSTLKFSKSLYIYSKDAKQAEGFTSTLKKPFLPTDLVELFSFLGKGIEESHEEISLDSMDDDISLDDDDMSLDDELSLDDDDMTFGDELSLDDDDMTFGDELSLDDDELSLGDEEFSLEDDDMSLDDESVLDEEEVQEVQTLLDETDLEDENIADELSLDDDELSLEDDFSLEDDDSLNMDEVGNDEFADIVNEFEENSELEDEESLEDELSIEDDEFSFEDEQEDDTDLESQIEDALDNLSDEDLESEVDEDELLEIASSEIDSLDALNSRDIKLAIGEEVEELDEEVTQEDDFETDEIYQEEEPEEATISDSEVDGVDALKNLLKALSDNNVAASLKGMKININITLGDK